MNTTTDSLLARAAISERIEWGLLLGLAFVLPLFEAPKNILWVAFIALWFANRWRARNFGGHWDLWDTLIVAWIASGYASAAFAGFHDNEWRAAADIVRYASVLWVLKRSRYPDRIWVEVTATVLAGTVVGLLWGYWTLYVSKTDRWLALNSVGHVNHSALYLAIVCGVAVAWVRAWWRDGGALSRAANLALLAMLVVSLFWMESRAAVGAAFLMAFALLAAYAGRRRKSLGLVGLMALVTVAGILLFSPQVVEKNKVFMQKGYLLNGRDEIWRVGIAEWREFPLFGVGMGNFSRVDYKQLESWSARRGEAFEQQTYFVSAHGHSLYVNTLAERGLVGLCALLAVLAGWAVVLIRGLPVANAPPVVWAYWGGAAGAWIVTILAGTVNTTLHDEQALLCMLLLGGCLSLRSDHALALRPAVAKSYPR
jgi:O-antigen ligase